MISWHTLGDNGYFLCFLQPAKIDPPEHALNDLVTRLLQRLTRMQMPTLNFLCLLPPPVISTFVRISSCQLHCFWFYNTQSRNALLEGKYQALKRTSRWLFFLLTIQQCSLFTPSGALSSKVSLT